MTSADSASIQPHGNLRMSLRKAGFSFPVHRTAADCSGVTQRSRVRKTASLPPTRRSQLAIYEPVIGVTDEGKTVVASERALDV